jgi:MFS family permease
MAVHHSSLIIFFVAVTGSFTFGFSNSCVGSVLGLPSFFSYFNLVEGSARYQSIIGAASGVFAGGSALGALCLAWLTDGIGRVRSLQVVCVICLLGGALQ